MPEYGALRNWRNKELPVLCAEEPGATRTRPSFGTIAGYAMAQARPHLEQVIHKKLWIAKVIHAETVALF
jgi:hypothetical protein